MFLCNIIPVIMGVIAEVAPNKFSVVYRGYASCCPEDLMGREIVAVGVADNEQIIEVIVL